MNWSINDTVNGRPFGRGDLFGSQLGEVCCHCLPPSRWGRRDGIFAQGATVGESGAVGQASSGILFLRVAGP